MCLNITAYLCAFVKMNKIFLFLKLNTNYMYELPDEHLFTYICPRPTGIAKKHFKGEIFNFLKIVYLHTYPVYNIIFCWVDQ